MTVEIMETQILSVLCFVVSHSCSGIPGVLHLDTLCDGSWHSLRRPSLQRGQPKHRPLSRLSREVSAEEAGLVRHAREYAAELAVLAGTAGVLRAASEKLRQEPKTFLPHQHHQVLILCLTAPLSLH